MNKNHPAGAWARRGSSPARDGLSLQPPLNSHSHSGGTRCRDVCNINSGLKQGGRESRRKICALPFSHLLVQPELQALPGSLQLPPTEAQAMP